MLPDRSILLPYLIRGAVLWLATRALLSAMLVLAGENPLRLTPVAFVGVVTASIVVGFIETHRHREQALLGNLGVSPTLLVALFAVPALLGELAIRVTANAIT